MLSLIWAQADNRAIGIDNRMPWHLPADMRYFRRTTTGKPVIMGRLTFESIGSKALPNRRNIVVSRNPDYPTPGCERVGSIEEALVSVADCDEVMVMGGARLYAQCLPLADRLYLTEVHTEIAGDAFFPELPAGMWQEVSREDFAADDENPYPYSFVVLERAAR